LQPRRRLAIGASALVGCLGLAASGTACSDASGGGSNRDVLEVVWTLAAEGDGWYGTPAVAGDLVVIEAPDGVLALRAGSGATVWKSHLWAPKVRSAFMLAVDAERVYFTELDSIYAISLVSGTRQWARPANASGAEVVVTGGLVVATTRDNTVIAFDAVTGESRWTTGLPTEWTLDGVLTGLGASGDTVYVGGSEYLTEFGGEKRGSIRGLDRATGRELWRYAASDRHSSVDRRVLVHDRLLLVSDLYGNSVFAVDRFTGREAWRMRGAPSGFGPDEAPEVIGDTAFVASNDQFVYALDVNDGHAYWSTRVLGSMHAFALCGPFVLGNNQGVAVVDRRSHRYLGDALAGDASAIGITTSDFGVALEAHGVPVAIVVGTGGVAALRCAR
jgi:outer membrane protein assembly factor BamB